MTGAGDASRFAPDESAADVLTGVAHEFNNVLTTILGYANLIGRSLEETDIRQHDVDEIVRAVRRANPLVEQLNAMAKRPDVEETRSGATARAQVPAGLARLPAAGSRVLVVEDEDSVRALVRAMLSRLGCEVIDCAGPHQAKAWARANADAIDLLVTDVSMPGGSGPSLYRELAVGRPGLKVLFMSGYLGATAQADDMTKLGGAFLEKPFGIDAFTRKVLEVLER